MVQFSRVSFGWRSTAKWHLKINVGMAGISLMDGNLVLLQNVAADPCIAFMFQFDLG